MKIRVQQSPSAIAMVKALGGVPTPMAQGELYTALQQGVVDGGENNPVVYADMRHAEVAKFYSATSTRWCRMSRSSVPKYLTN